MIWSVHDAPPPFMDLFKAGIRHHEGVRVCRDSQLHLLGFRRKREDIVENRHLNSIATSRNLPRSLDGEPGEQDSTGTILPAGGPVPRAVYAGGRGRGRGVRAAGSPRSRRPRPRGGGPDQRRRRLPGRSVAVDFFGHSIGAGRPLKAAFPKTRKTKPGRSSFRRRPRRRFCCFAGRACACCSAGRRSHRAPCWSGGRPFCRWADLRRGRGGEDAAEEVRSRRAMVGGPALEVAQEPVRRQPDCVPHFTGGGRRCEPEPARRRPLRQRVQHQLAVRQNGGATGARSGFARAMGSPALMSVALKSRRWRSAVSWPTPPFRCAAGMRPDAPPKCTCRPCSTDTRSLHRSSTVPIR